MRQGRLKNIFDVLEKAFGALGIDYYLIGALARQVWYEREGMAFRNTMDVDYAALIGSNQEYQKVKQYLKEHENFMEYKGNAFVMIAPDGTQVDILPFGKIEEKGGVEIDGTGMTSIRVDGMMEVYESGTEEIMFETGNKFKVATLPGIALLKFIAYDDRPEQRAKDVLDITNLIVHFFTLNANFIYDEHNDLFTEEEKDLSLEEIGAIVLGREIKKMILKNEYLSDRLEKILKRHILLAEKGAFVRLMVQADKEATVEKMINYLQKVLRGFTNSSK